MTTWNRVPWDRLVSVILSGAVLMSSLSCHHRIPRIEDQQPRIVWPPPPDQPRIEYVRSFRRPRDLGIRRNWLFRFLANLGRGRRTMEMVRPHGVTVAPDGKIAVADPESRSVHLYDPGRSTYRRLTLADGEPLESPIGVAADAEGRIYVSDSIRRAIFRFTPKGKWLDTIGGEEELLRPTGLALDRGRDTLYVVDTLGHRIVVFNLEGVRTKRFGRRGQGEGEFNFPVAVAVGPAGHLYVTDSMNFRVQILDPSGRFLATFGQPGNGPGDFDKAKGIALDAEGHIYVVETLHDVIHVYDPEGQLLTVIGGTGTGPGRFWLPTWVHIDPRGRILVSDSANHRVQVLQYLEEPETGEQG